MTPETISLYYREGSSDKVYQATLEQKDGGFVVNFAFGRRGSTLQTGTKTTSPVPYDKAKAIYDKLVKEKTGKGYTPSEDGAPYQHADRQDSGVRCQLLNPIGEESVARLIDDWRYWLQEKFDGRRMLMNKDGSDVSGINRKGLSVGLPKALVTAAKSFDGSWIIDGESVGETLYAFDLLELNGEDLRIKPYSHRLHKLSHLLGAMKKAIVPVETALSSQTKRVLFERLKKAGKEGVVFKDPGAPYTPGRPNSGGPQLKHKFYATASFVVAKINDKRSVALEVLDGKKRVGAGNVTIPPNHQVPKEGAVVEVRYLHAFAESGSVYQPVYLGVRDDIKPQECTAKQLKYRAPQEDDEA